MCMHGLTHDVERVLHELPLMGTDIDACNDETLDIEIFPDRPDLLSGETLAYAMRPFLHNSVAVPSLATQPSGITMEVDASLQDIRPVVLGAVVRGVNMPKTSEMPSSRD